MNCYRVYLLATRAWRQTGVFQMDKRDIVCLCNKKNGYCVTLLLDNSFLITKLLMAKMGGYCAGNTVIAS